MRNVTLIGQIFECAFLGLWLLFPGAVPVVAINASIWSIGYFCPDLLSFMVALIRFQLWWLTVVKHNWYAVLLRATTAGMHNLFRLASRTRLKGNRKVFIICTGENMAFCTERH